MSPLYPGGHSHTGVESCTWLLLRVHFPITHKGHQLPLDPLNACGNYINTFMSMYSCVSLPLFLQWSAHGEDILTPHCSPVGKRSIFFQFSKLKPFNQSSTFVLSHDSI